MQRCKKKDRQSATRRGCVLMLVFWDSSSFPVCCCFFLWESRVCCENWLLCLCFLIVFFGCVCRCATGGSVFIGSMWCFFHRSRCLSNEEKSGFVDAHVIDFIVCQVAQTMTYTHRYTHIHTHTYTYIHIHATNPHSRSIITDLPLSRLCILLRILLRIRFFLKFLKFSSVLLSDALQR